MFRRRARAQHSMQEEGIKGQLKAVRQRTIEEIRERRERGPTVPSKRFDRLADPFPQLKALRKLTGCAVTKENTWEGIRHTTTTTNNATENGNIGTRDVNRNSKGRSKRKGVSVIGQQRKASRRKRPQSASSHNSRRTNKQNSNFTNTSSSSKSGNSSTESYAWRWNYFRTRCE